MEMEMGTTKEGKISERVTEVRRVSQIRKENLMNQASVFVW